MRYMLFDGNVAAYGNTASAIYISTGSASTAQRDMWIDHCRFVNNVGNRYTVYVDTNYTNKNLLKINDTDFDSNTVKYGRTDGDAALLHIAYGNSVQMSNCTITKTQGEGRILRYYGGGTLDKDGNAFPATGTFTNVTITDNKNCYYTPVSLPNANRADSDEWKKLSIQAQSTWTDCTITGNAASITSQDGAGGFEVYKQNVTLEHCTISNNSGPNGGVYVSSPLTNYGFGDQQEGVVTFTNCDITGNHGTAARGAGGMGISYYQSVRGIVNLTDCTIKDNTGNYGGGIRVGGNDNDDWNASGLGTLNATNCTISRNTATVKGGGIFASAYDTKDGESRLRLTDCTITNNTANYGGGIYAARQIKPEKRNKDSQYRDYYVNHAADTQTMIVTGGTIADNIAQKYGGGISTDVVGKNTNYNTLIVKVAGGTVENNRAQLGQDVYAYKTKADTVLHLPKASAIHDNGRWLNENTSETLKDEPIDYDPIQRTYPLTLSVPKVETEVAQIVKDGEVVGSPYDSLQEAMDATRAMLAEDADQKLTVQLLANTNSSTQISQDTNVTLDLAGHTITGIGGKPALTVESDVNIINSNPAKGGTISGTATDGGALLLRNNANVTMTDTTITNSRAAYRGGAVCVDSGSSFTLGQGSSITGCQAGRGGAVYVIDGSFTQIDDAVITNCSVFENAAFSACGYGGAVYVAKGIYTLQSGSVTNNSATKNGIIYIANNSGAEFTMTKGEISGNTCKNGTIYQAGGTMTLAGGSITGNTCTESGGGVYQNGGSSLLLGTTNASQDVVISGNKAVNGAGWYINGGNCLMRGGNITGNKATKRGGGVCQSNGTLTVNGGDITTNNAPEGGGLCHSGGTFNFQGGGLYGNIATGDDGGNDVYSTSKNGVMDLIAAAAMDSDKYNVWRDDYYPYTFTKNYHNTSDKIAAEGTEDGGKYLTSTVPNVNNVKLTADYYENSNIEIESNDMYIYRMSITKQDTGDGEKDYYDAEDGVITAGEVLRKEKTAANVKSVEPAGETYPLNYDKDTPDNVKTVETLKVTYTDNRPEEIVRPETPVQWTAGSDATKENALIRSFSTANYIVSLDTKSAGMGDKLLNATERLWMRIKVPCESGEISLSGNGTVFKSSYTYYDPELHCQILEGYQDHVIEEKDLGTMNMTMQFSIKVGGMHNGATVQPTIEAWFDNSSYQSYRTKTNPYDDRVVLDANTMRVSAKAAYNLSVGNNPSLRHIGYFDMDTKTEITEQQYKANDTPVLKDGSEGNGWQYDRWERADGAGLDDSQPLWEKQPNTRDNGGTADMDKYSFNDMEMTVGSDGATKEIKGLVYYDTLTELEKAGHTCVAVLYQIRNCCVRTGRSVEIGHMMEVTKDVSKIGRSYALTMDVRGWTTYRPFYRSATATGSNPGWTRLMDNGTVLTKRSELLYQGLIEGKGEQANAPVSHPLTSAKNSTIHWDIGTPTISRITNNYQKTQYSNGYEVGGSHSGYLSGNTVLLATQNATVEIKTTDVAEGNIRQTDYQLDEGQRTVTVQVTPRVTMQSNAKANLEVFDGTTQTDLTLDVKLPKDLTLQEGTLTFDYSNSSYNRGDLTWEAKYQYWDGTTWQEFNFETNYEQSYVQQPTRLHLTTTITDVKKVLPVLSFKAGIGYPADPGLDITGEKDQDGAWYKNLRIDAEIHTTYEEEDVNASLGRTDYTEIKVLRNSKTVVNKTAASNLVEIGDVLAYDLTYIKEDGATSDLELCDLLPYNTEKAKTFHGAYGLKSVTVTVQNADGTAINLGTDDITVKYAGTDSVAYTNKGVLDRVATMQKAGSKGTPLTTTTKNTKDNSVTFTPDTMPIHRATGKSELGSLYLQLQNLPNAIVKVHVELAVTQTKDGVNALLTDNDNTVQQSNDTYNNIYFARAGGENNALLTSPTASIKVRSRSISGLVWMDQNYDGIYTTKLDDTGKKNVGSDKTLAGIIVTLVQTKPNTKDENPVYTDDAGNNYYAVTDTLGNKVQPVTTKKDGRYTFENLKQGEYRVLFTDSKDGYKMEDDSKPVLPFGKLSVTKRDAMGDTSNKTAPQYRTEDANTLQAAMSEEITQGDAVLTGRDDKTNINAGFYYTELRLAKVWQNIPDAKKAAEAEVNFTLAATQGEEKLEEAVYTLTNKTVSDPAKAAQDASDLTLFGKFVGTGVDFTDDSAERTVRWQTTQGLPLQAENANGPITYTLKQDTVRADGDTWIGNVSFVQKQDTEKVSSGAESDNSVIATRLVAVNTARTYEILIHKLSDVENKELEQAEFTATLQPASPLEKLLGGKVEIKSQQTIQRTGENKETEEIRYRLTDLTAGTYTLAETKAPLGYAKDPVKYKLTITDRDEKGNTLPIITLEDDKGNLLYTAKMTPDQEKGDYSVDVTAGDGRDTSTASAVMTAGSCLETTEQEQSNLPIRTQISMEITDSYLFSLPFTGGSGMNRSLLQGVAVMALAAAAFAVTAIHRKKKNHS